MFYISSAEQEGVFGVGFVVATDTLLMMGLRGVAYARASNANTVSSSSTSRPVERVLWHDDDLHVALIAADIGGMSPLPLASRPPFEAPTGREIAVLGYPMPDGRLPSAVSDAIYGEVFGVKRVMPGKLVGRSGKLNPTISGNYLTHDATTTSGVEARSWISRQAPSSGFTWAGPGPARRKENYALPIWELLARPEVLAILTERGAAMETPT